MRRPFALILLTAALGLALAAVWMQPRPPAPPVRH